MSKFSGRGALPVADRVTRATTPVRTVGSAVTHEGAAGSARDAKSELFLLAVTNMVGEDTFYETADARDARFVDLVHQVTAEDPVFVQRLIPWLRNVANMRSAPVVAAAEYVRAGGPNGRRVVASALARAEEPAEIVGYWLATHGRALPKPLKRGVADATVRLYNERSLLKHDGQSAAVRFGDVIDLTHPKASAPWQSSLFRHALDRRHNRDAVDVEQLPKIREDLALQQLPVDQRWAALERAVNAGWAWERLFSWLPNLSEPGAKAKAWEALIPSMGYMALLRNLRNFDDAGVSDAVADTVAQRLSDPAQVARSRQFPFRFLSAWLATRSMRWGTTLERALDASTANLPELADDTLVLIDVSGSMDRTLSAKSTVARWQAGALFGLAMAKRTTRTRVVLFGTRSVELPVTAGQSVLRAMETVRPTARRYNLDHGTNGYQALNLHYRGERRVVFFTDEQFHPYSSQELAIADRVPLLYMFNLAGYRPGVSSGKPGRHTLGGFSDATFRFMAAVESYESAGWDGLFGTPEG